MIYTSGFFGRGGEGVNPPKKPVVAGKTNTRGAITKKKYELSSSYIYIIHVLGSLSPGGSRGLGDIPS